MSNRHTAPSPTDVAAALAALAPARCEDRETWVRVGQAIHAWDSTDVGFQVWTGWSKQSPKYNETDARTVWQSFEPGKGRTIGTLLAMAREDGWTGPQNGRQGASQGLARYLPRPLSTQPAKRPRQPRIASAGGAKFWPDLETAQTTFATLPLAHDDPEAVAMLLTDYGIEQAAIPEDWRVGDYPGMGRGIIYPGTAPDGTICAYKWRSLARNQGGKRDARFLHGDASGALQRRCAVDEAPTVIVSGEEKSVAAWLATHHVLAPMTGEQRLADHWIAYLCQDPRPLILANDNDETGARANRETAQALEAAGYDPALIRIVAWPEDAPDGYDLNDALREAGHAAVMRLLSEAAPLPVSVRASSLRDFLAMPRPPLAYWIEGLLPVQGKLLFSSGPKLHKTFLAQEFGLCLASGHCEFLGLRFGQPARVLMLQPELSDGLMAQRSTWIRDTAPRWLDLNGALDRFFLAETDVSRPCLSTPEGRAHAETLISRHRPDVLICDPLYMLFAGLEENAAEEMTMVLNYLGDLTARFHLAVILTHHFNKSGTAARGSSVLSGWPETELTLTPVECDEPGVVRVDGLFRCSFGKGFPAYWRRPTETDAWFSTMPEGWVPEQVGPGRRMVAGPKQISLVLQAAKQPLGWKALASAVAANCDCSERTAARAIERAESAGIIRKENGCYLPNNN